MHDSDANISLQGRFSNLNFHNVSDFELKISEKCKVLGENF